jgi:hypothetical protein
MPTTLENEHFAGCRRWQEHYQNAVASIDGRIPAPVFGQSVNEYRTEVLRLLKRTFLPQNHDLYRINYRGLKNDSAALAALEPQLLREVVVQANNPANVPRGELREIKEFDRTGTLMSSRFIGQESFVKAMTRPGRRVLGFLHSNRHYYNTNGQQTG